MSFQHVVRLAELNVLRFLVKEKKMKRERKIMASELNLATASAQALDMSVFGLFMMADPVVKAVMLLLIGASVWCWAIIFDKMTRIRRQKRVQKSLMICSGQAGHLMIYIII